MTTTSTRVLRLLSLLQTRREWAGAELSERLDVDVRTVRRDAQRLRELGYVIDASAGPGGGYRLSGGAHTPPLLLDDTEAVTVALALGAAATSFGNFADAALGVLLKLDQLLPSRLRRKWTALTNVTMSLAEGANPMDVKQLATLAAACRDERRVTFTYGDRQQRQTLRDVEPMRLVNTGRVWYLVAWDVGREAWRTFRLDRVDAEGRIRVGDRFVPRRPPEDFSTFVSRSITSAPYLYSARFRLPISIAEARKHVPAWVGLLEARDECNCVLTVGGNSYQAIAAVLVNIGADFELIEPVALAGPLREIANRLLKSVRQTAETLEGK